MYVYMLPQTTFGHGSAYDYYDPEAVSGGSAIWGTPPLKTVTFGLSVNF